MKTRRSFHLTKARVRCIPGLGKFEEGREGKAEEGAAVVKRSIPHPQRP